MRIEFEYWILTGPDECYDNRYEIGEGETEEKCLEDAKRRAPRRAKKWKKYKELA